MWLNNNFNDTVKEVEESIAPFHEQVKEMQKSIEELEDLEKMLLGKMSPAPKKRSPSILHNNTIPSFNDSINPEMLLQSAGPDDNDFGPPNTVFVQNETGGSHASSYMYNENDFEPEPLQATILTVATPEEISVTQKQQDAFDEILAEFADFISPAHQELANEDPRTTVREALRADSVREKMENCCIPSVMHIKLLQSLDGAMAKSEESQIKLQEWDRRMSGLKRNHSKTMRDASRSRKKVRAFARNEITKSLSAKAA